jgi:hypothetical protein
LLFKLNGRFIQTAEVFIPSVEIVGLRLGGLFVGLGFCRLAVGVELLCTGQAINGGAVVVKRNATLFVACKEGIKVGSLPCIKAAFLRREPADLLEHLGKLIDLGLGLFGGLSRGPKCFGVDNRL